MENVLRAQNLTKKFPGVLAVDNVSFDLGKGEVLALVGENGAGKSTIMKMICGVLKPDEGCIYLNGERKNFNSANDAFTEGIGIVYQELSIAGSLSVAENLFMNRQPVNKLNIVDWRKLYRQSEELLRRFNLKLSPKLLAKRLSLGQQQLLEILKAISANPRVLILDEPTSSLTEHEVEILFENIKELKNEGMSFIYISHKLSEIFRIADRVAVMRDGKCIDINSISVVTETDLISKMVGRDIQDLYGRETVKKEFHEPFFTVKNLTKKDVFENVSFLLHRGEVLGFAGLIGAGRTEVALTLFGVMKADSGTLQFNNNTLVFHTPKDAVKNKIAYLTEDRKNEGLYLFSQLKDNLIAPSLKKFTKKTGLVDHKKVARYAENQVEEFAIETPGIMQKVQNLSGGNQQKCLISMWMGTDPEVIIFDEPTRGVDVGARSEIYEKINEYASRGKGIIVISSDLPELIGLCDRVIVMWQGKVTGEIARADFSEERILSYAAGLNIDSVEE